MIVGARTSGKCPAISLEKRGTNETLTSIQTAFNSSVCRPTLRGAAGDAGRPVAGPGTIQRLAALFVQNQGQWADTAIRYGFDGAGCAIAFRDSGRQDRFKAIGEFLLKLDFLLENSFFMLYHNHA